jgi:hypothetical protein
LDVKIITTLLGNRHRCSLCKRGKVVRGRHFCQGCRDQLWSLSKRRDSAEHDQLVAELSGAQILDLDPALQASHGDKSVIEEISRGLEQANSEVRDSAARELALLNNPLAVDPLGVCLVKFHSLAAVNALAQIGDVRAAKYMYAALNMDDYWWRPQQEKVGDSWRYITVYPYDEEMIHRLRRLGGQELIIRTFVRLVEDPETRRHDAAAGVLLQFAQHGGARGDFKKDPTSREMMIDAAHNLLRGNATDRETASQILSHLGGHQQNPT